MAAASWIGDEEKYALIALSVTLHDPVPLQEMTPQHWAFADERFDVPSHWREWFSRTSGIGPFATFRNVRARSAIRGEADSFCSLRA